MENEGFGEGLFDDDDDDWVPPQRLIFPVYEGLGLGMRVCESCAKDTDHIWSVDRLDVYCSVCHRMEDQLKEKYVRYIERRLDCLIDHATHMYRYLIAIGWEPDADNIEIPNELFRQAIDELNDYASP